MSRVSFFEIPVDNPVRAIDFFTRVFGWTITPWAGANDYWLVRTGTDHEPGINGAIFKRPGHDNVTNSIDVPSLDSTMESIEVNGGTVITPRSTIPSVGYVGCFRDTEGNEFDLMQRDTAAH
jgi:predicted enzyme related to lactoylglutathione lyase